MMPHAKTGREINVDFTTRVKEEGSLNIVTENGNVKHLQLRILEPPRFFENFLRGRSFHEVPDVIARICDSCPVAYQMSSVHALEKALNVTISPEIRRLRRLFYCAEWIESHAHHIYLLHAPDLLGYQSAVAMVTQPNLKPLIQRGLRLKKIGKELLTCIGGRESHPVSPCVGGFFRAPRHWELQALLDELTWGLQAACDTVTWVTSFNHPDFSRNYEFVSLVHPDEYPLNQGRVVSSSGLDISMEEFEEHFAEEWLPGSGATYGLRIDQGSYHIGPLARLNLNHNKLMPEAQKVLEQTGLTFPVNNPFKSIIARAIEMVHMFEEALHIINTYKMPVPCRISVQPGEGRGHHITEAPRGMMVHHFQLDKMGRVEDAHIWTPTAQNLKQIEDDLRAFVPSVLHLPLKEATERCEQLVRNYNPCISCATNYLKLNIERR